MRAHVSTLEPTTSVPGNEAARGSLRAALGPRLAVASELSSALFEAACLGPRALLALRGRATRRARLQAALTAGPVPMAAAPRLCLPNRPLRIFLSCAEVSGEMHALNLLDELRALLRAEGAPEPEILGLGGARLAARGVALLGRPVERAAMGLEAVAKALPYYLRLVEDSARALNGAHGRIDLFLPVDSPALHAPLGRIARRAGVPVAHFVAPQHWAWAGWRTVHYARAVDRVLCILPFEAAWFEARGLCARYVGHPLCDELANTPRGTTPRNRLLLLPGSRRSVIERNLPWMLAAVEPLAAAQPALEIVSPQSRPEQAEAARQVLESMRARHPALVARVRVAGGDLHQELAGARAALAVSGTVLLDLLHQRVPAVVLYRLERAWQERWRERLLDAPWFAITNLLAGRELLPEFAFHARTNSEGPLQAVRLALASALEAGPGREAQLAGLELAAQRLGPPGACRRAAAQALELCQERLAGSRT